MLARMCLHLTSFDGIYWLGEVRVANSATVKSIANILSASVMHSEAIQWMYRKCCLKRFSMHVRSVNSAFNNQRDIERHHCVCVCVWVIANELCGH